MKRFTSPSRPLSQYRCHPAFPCRPQSCGGPEVCLAYELRRCPVPGQSYGNMIIRVLAPPLSHIRTALRPVGTARPVIGLQGHRHVVLAAGTNAEVSQEAIEALAAALESTDDAARLPVLSLQPKTCSPRPGIDQPASPPSLISPIARHVTTLPRC